MGLSDLHLLLEGVDFRTPRFKRVVVERVN
jgi:hypothetical protein